MGFVLEAEGNLGKFLGVEAVWVERVDGAPAGLGTVVGEGGDDGFYGGGG